MPFILGQLFYNFYNVLQYSIYIVCGPFIRCCLLLLPLLGGWFLNATVAALLPLLVLLLLLLLRILGRTRVCSAILPSPGLELLFAPLALANQQLSLLCTVQDLFNQAQPGQHGSILELSADANLQFGRGSTADRSHTSQLSLSTNCSVTAPATLNIVSLVEFWISPKTF